MKNSYVLVAALTLILLMASVTVAHVAEKELLPESIEARSEIAPVEKTLTIFLEEDDPEKLTELLNSSNQEYGKKGWSIFAIIPYTKNGDVDGFFVTYSKGLTVE